MSEFSVFRTTNCTCCLKRLDKTKQANVRRVNDNNFLNKLNTVKPIILTNKRKQNDITLINIGDIVCGLCRSYANNYKLDNVTNVFHLYPSLNDPFIADMSLGLPGIHL